MEEKLSQKCNNGCEKLGCRLVFPVFSFNVREGAKTVNWEGRWCIEQR